ncbi:MAG TPA: YbhB/YbcL family Raf kinase inhibitor-like protein [Armatimonadota bacterium]|nr:YbhB/YbcL family Raf kinase inhibitor-like protein [Armatimonadota bacterium]
MALQVTSMAFREGEALPARYTCDGDGVSPPLAWAGAPEATESFAVLCEDPDAPRGPFIHWVLYNLPAGIRALDEGVPPQESFSGGGLQGVNTALGIGYTAPCPPRGQAHRYQFRVFALDQRLDLPPRATHAQLMRALYGHVLGEGRLTGVYARTEERAA